MDAASQGFEMLHTMWWVHRYEGGEARALLETQLETWMPWYQGTTLPTRSTGFQGSTALRCDQQWSKTTAEHETGIHLLAARR